MASRAEILDTIAGPVQMAQLCHLYSVENLLPYNYLGRIYFIGTKPPLLPSVKPKSLKCSLVPNFSQGGQPQENLLGHAHSCDCTHFWC